MENTPQLTRDKYGSYLIDGERVFISFTWQVKAKIKRKKTVRVQEFEVSAKDRAMAIYALNRRYKGAFVQEVLSLTPANFWHGCFWIDREGHPEIYRETLSKISLPTDL